MKTSNILNEDPRSNGFKVRKLNLEPDINIINKYEAVNPNKIIIIINERSKEIEV